MLLLIENTIYLGQILVLGALTLIQASSNADRRRFLKWVSVRTQTVPAQRFSNCGSGVTWWVSTQFLVGPAEPPMETKVMEASDNSMRRTQRLFKTTLRRAELLQFASSCKYREIKVWASFFSGVFFFKSEVFGQWKPFLTGFKVACYIHLKGCCPLPRFIWVSSGTTGVTQALSHWSDRQGVVKSIIRVRCNWVRAFKFMGTCYFIRT